jgi:hypothetical protein
VIFGQVSVIGAGEVWLGNAPITTANIQASNGLIHILGGIPSVGPFLNESSITSASSLSNFGPFTIDKVPPIFHPGASAEHTVW